MKKSFKFLIVFFTIAIILCCSVFVSAATLTKETFSPLDLTSNTITVTTQDNSKYYTYDVTMNSSGVITKNVEANPGGIVSPWRFYTGLNFSKYNITVPKGYYLNISFSFYVLYSSSANLSVDKIQIQCYSGREQESIFYADVEEIPTFTDDGSGLKTGKVNVNISYFNDNAQMFFFGLVPIVDISGRNYQYMSVGFNFNDVSVNVSQNVPQYTSPSDSAITEQDQLTSELENQTAEGNQEATNIFNSFDGLLGSDSHIYKGLLCCTTILNEWLGVEWISPIVFFGLVLGMFAFLLGSSFLVTRAIKVSTNKSYSKER